MRYEQRNRLIILAIGLVFAFAAIVFVASSIAHRAPAETTFEPTLDAQGRPLIMYVEVTAVEALRASMTIRLDFATAQNRLGAHYAAAADRNITVIASDGATQQQIILRQGQPLITVMIAADLAADTIEQYPFDRYTAALTLSAFEGVGVTHGPQIPLRVTLWGRLAGWDVTAHPERGPDGLSLSFEVIRPNVQVIIALLLYGAMSVLALVALTVSSLLYIGIRKVHPTLAAAQAAMLFTLPSLRNMMPNAPPVGTRADMIMFVADIVVVLSLALTIATWSRRGD